MGEVVGDTAVTQPGSVDPVAESQRFVDRLAEVDVDALSDHDRAHFIRTLERVKGGASAAQARATDALRRSREAAAPRDAARSVGSEVALARRESPSAGDRLVGLARALVHEMPHTMTALTRGDIVERHATECVRETAVLSAEDRREVDRRLAGLLSRLSAPALGRAARRVAAELDAASVVRRMDAAVASRRVSVRPAPDGMAYLTVLGPMRDVVGAHAALLARSRSVVGGQCPEEGPDGRGVGAVAADAALRLLSGREVGQVQPLEVHLVMTDRSLLGTGDPGSSVMEPARVPGHGPVPAPVARAWVRDAGPASVWLRRLHTSPEGRDLVAMDSRRRVFGGLLRRMLVLRDDVCSTPWCDAPIVHADHARPVREGGATVFENGSGTCARCNQVKEAPGWQVEVIGNAPRELVVTTPAGHRHRSTSPPLLGWGSDPPLVHPPPAPPTSPRSLSAPTPSALEARLAALLDAS
ncbi:DUF222 domain-containing protein [Phycicoccus sp. CSK15P-2]|uniref:HNH endonuclease signature motif containing protein n=1 Tax=Phycicoccus sp. CSK15P-2 TaxID=2807627 RepID=UPI00194E3EF1|nr:DUF222 domain-containing protein [Phycicoccus sp. CSK15P-2]MBM6404418.1 DUF222 domain-containing protein [Phycicoccus sp. CSK15P-2]